MSYYRHRVKRYYGDIKQTSDFGWTFTTQTAEELQKEISNDCDETNSKYPFQINEYVYLTHEIDEDSFNNNDQFSIPLNQYIWRI